MSAAANHAEVPNGPKLDESRSAWRTRRLKSSAEVLSFAKECASSRFALDYPTNS
jgi:hypothetical protein